MAESTTSRPPRKGPGPANRAGRSESFGSTGVPANSEPSNVERIDLQGDVTASPSSCLGSSAQVYRPLRRQANVAFVGDRHAWAKALCRRDEGAAVAFFDEYVVLVERTISRILGIDADLSDVAQEVFIRCLEAIHKLKDPQAMTQWVIQISVCTASDWLRRRNRRRWLMFSDPKDLANHPTPTVDSTSLEAARATYWALDQLGVDERAAFALRFINGMELREVASACNCSLATIKRRLARAEARFEAIARNHPVLATWISESRGGRPES